MKAKKAKRRTLADMDFGEGLARLIQTKPGEVKRPGSKKPMAAKAAKRLMPLRTPPDSADKKDQQTDQ